MTEDLDLEFVEISALSLEKGKTIRITRGSDVRVRTIDQVMEAQHSDLITVHYTDCSFEMFDIPRKYAEQHLPVPKIEVLRPVVKENKMTIKEMEDLLKEHWILKVEQGMPSVTPESYLVRYFSKMYLVSRSSENPERVLIKSTKHTQALANVVSVIENPADSMNIYVAMVREITNMLDPSGGNRVGKATHQIIKYGSLEQRKEAIRTILESL